MQGAIRLIAFALAGVVPPSLYSADIERRSAPALPVSSVNVSLLLAGLDSPEYATRRSAAAGLEKLLESPNQWTAAEKQLWHAPWPTLSFEARQQLEALGLLDSGANNAALSEEEVVSREEVVALVKTLTSDRYLDRAGALKQLGAAVRRARLSHHVYPALKQAAAEATLSTDVRVLLASLLETARYTWLTSTESRPAQPPSADEIASWIDVLLAPDEAGDVADDRNTAAQKAARRNAAERELLDALAQHRAAPALLQALEDASTREGLDGDALVRLRRLAEWARPGLAVEYWQRRRNLAIQYFVVGVPSQAPGAMRPTRFDRVADDVAFCASGNALRPGEYPLGVAFPHPREQAAFFHLVSLPTARERLIYQFEIQALHEGERLSEITERTIGPAIARNRPLDDSQLWLLGQLDQPTVARLLRAYFAEVPDEPFDLSQLAPMLSDVSSVHRTACLMLALDGSHEVVPMLVDAAQSKQLLGLSPNDRQAMAWIAALTIATREPWNDVDVWLAELVDRTDRISFGLGTHGDLGATAAAMLLSRHGEAPDQFGLIAREPLERGLHDRFEAPINEDYRRRMFEDRMFKQLGMTPHSFTEADARTAVQTWWNRRQASPLPTPPIYTLPAPVFTARAARP